MIAPAGSAEAAKYSGTMLYNKPGCRGTQQTVKNAPLRNVRVSVVRGPHEVRTRTNKNGEWSATLPGSGPAAAEVSLESKIVELSLASRPRDPWRSFVRVDAARPERFVVPTFMPFVWTTINHHGARLLPVLKNLARLPQAHVIYDAKGTAAHLSTIYMRRGDWDYALHEYGHVIQWAVAEIPRLRGVEYHALTDSFPGNPSVAFAEGFANAFAQLMLGTPVARVDCEIVMNVGRRPATPVSRPNVHAQFNEVAIAGVVWHLTLYLGGRSTLKGLRKLLTAMKRYSRDHPHAADIRDLRDSLIRVGYERSQGTHDALTEIFDRQRIRWSIVLTGNKPSWDSRYSAGNDEIIAYVTGDYPCTSLGANVNERGAGGLPHAVHDDCVDFEDGYPLDIDGTNIGPGLTIWFPYQSGDEHRTGKWTLWVMHSCFPVFYDEIMVADCPPSVLWQGELERGVARYGLRQPLLAWRLGPISLGNHQPVPVAEFNGDYGCVLLIPPGGDCSTNSRRPVSQE